VRDVWAGDADQAKLRELPNLRPIDSLGEDTYELIGTDANIIGKKIYRSNINTDASILATLKAEAAKNKFSPIADKISEETAVFDIEPLHRDETTAMKTIQGVFNKYQQIAEIQQTYGNTRVNLTFFDNAEPWLPMAGMAFNYDKNTQGQNVIGQPLSVSVALDRGNHVEQVGPNEPVLPFTRRVHVLDIGLNVGFTEYSSIFDGVMEARDDGMYQRAGLSAEQSFALINARLNAVALAVQNEDGAAADGTDMKDCESRVQLPFN